ncbi:MAG: molybdate ABC transporter substrate-binding protein [Candidatus Acidiferrum sp.]
MIGSEKRTISILCLLLSAGLLGSVPACPQNEPVRIAAAADLKFVMTDLAHEFGKATGNRLDVTYGSSGNFFAQLRNGAPWDMYFSADIDYPKQLQTAGLTEPGTLWKYAVGRIVIWAPEDASVDVSAQGWKALLDSKVRKIAIANPEHAPYGRAAVAALIKAGVYDAVKSKLVYGENISQAAQFVQSGNAQAGILAMSLTLSPGMKNGESWVIPAEMHPPIEQGAVVLKNAKNKKAALTFLEFVKSDMGRATLARYGFTAPFDSEPRQ